MATTQVLVSLAIIIVSFIIGFIFFYSTSNLEKKEKKTQIEEITSLLINFVIFIWVAKVLLNLSLFIKDPFAVLAYPSNSNALYLATLFIIINIVYRIKRHQFNVQPLYISFVPIFLSASFIFEFIQIVWVKSAYSWLYLGLLMLLILVFVLLNDSVSKVKVAYNLMLAWSLGTLILALILPFTTVFGYTMTPWYLISLAVVHLILIMYNYRRRGY